LNKVFSIIRWETLHGNGIFKDKFFDMFKIGLKVIFIIAGLEKSKACDGGLLIQDWCEIWSEKNFKK